MLVPCRGSGSVFMFLFFNGINSEQEIVMRRNTSFFRLLELIPILGLYLTFLYVVVQGACVQRRVTDCT